jgi:peroxiredoxin
MKLKNLILSVSLACVACLSRDVVADPAVVGAAAPAFEAIDTEGVKHSLSNYKGKNVVLEWFNPECPFVKKFYRNGDMAKLQKRVVEGGDIWLTINSSAAGKQGHIDPDQATGMQTKLGVAGTALLLDPQGTVGRAYGARTTPHLFVIDAQGVLAYAGAIDSTPSTDPSDIAASTNYVIKAIQDLKSGSKVQTSSTEPYGCSVKYDASMKG